MDERLEMEFIADKVGVALKQMSALKSFGLDGFEAGFYQNHWHTVWEDTCRAILEFLNSGEMSLGLNHTLIALIPKVKSLTTVKEYRPICLSNMLYKLISKVLTNRIKKVLLEIISSN